MSRVWDRWCVASDRAEEREEETLWAVSWAMWAASESRARPRARSADSRVVVKDAVWARWTSEESSEFHLSLAEVMSVAVGDGW